MYIRFYNNSVQCTLSHSAAHIIYNYIVQDPYPVHRLVRRENRRPAILIGLRDIENDVGIIKVSLLLLLLLFLWLFLQIIKTLLKSLLLKKKLGNVDNSEIILMVFNKICM